MKKILLFVIAVSSMAFGVAAQTAPAPTPAAAPTPPPMLLKVGEMAPDFTLNDTAGNKVTLSSFRGKNNVVLAFFVLAFTGG